MGQVVHDVMADGGASFLPSWPGLTGPSRSDEARTGLAFGAAASGDGSVKPGHDEAFCDHDEALGGHIGVWVPMTRKRQESLNA
jgi:hypothetical protein